MRDLSRGQVRLAMTPTFTAYLVGPLVPAFHARHPGIQVTIRELSLDTMAAAVAADEVDLGIAFRLNRAAEIECLPLFVERLSIVVASSHAWAKGRHTDMHVVAEMELALLSTDFATRTHIDHHLQKHRLAPKVAIEANTISALLEIVRRSELAPILPEAICAQVPDLRNLALRPAPPPRTRDAIAAQRKLSERGGACVR